VSAQESIWGEALNKTGYPALCRCVTPYLCQRIWGRAEGV